MEGLTQEVRQAVRSFCGNPGFTATALVEGYDPTIGILHGRESERGMYPAFALDRMEPMRPVVDRVVLDLVKTTTFSGGDFAMQPDGAAA